MREVLLRSQWLLCAAPAGARLQVQGLLAHVLYGTTTQLPRTHQLLLVTVDDAAWTRLNVRFGRNGLREPVHLSLAWSISKASDTSRLRTLGEHISYRRCWRGTGIISMPLPPNRFSR
jgi:hypothetical protein